MNEVEFQARWGFPAGAAFENVAEIQEHSDRKGWLPGPWDAEPFDKVVWVDQKTGLDCMMVRGGQGSWCGYVGVPDKHPLFAREYTMCVHPKHKPISPKKILQQYRRKAVMAKSRSERESWYRLAEMHQRWAGPGRTKCSWRHSVESKLEAHGGITYSAQCAGVICHHAPGRPEVWWFGFDCAHYMDLSPGRLAHSKQMAEAHPDDRSVMGGPLWDDHNHYDSTTGAVNRFGTSEIYRDVAYVKAEVERLAEQLYEWTSKGC